MDFKHRHQTDDRKREMQEFAEDDQRKFRKFRMHIIFNNDLDAKTGMVEQRNQEKRHEDGIMGYAKPVADITIQHRGKQGIDKP